MNVIHQILICISIILIHCVVCISMGRAFYLKFTVSTYLIFVIFFTQAKFLENKIYTEKRVNYNKFHSKLPILRVNYDKLHSKLPIFRVKSVKIYTEQKKFTRALPVAPMTNMRYEHSSEAPQNPTHFIGSASPSATQMSGPGHPLASNSPGQLFIPFPSPQSAIVQGPQFAATASSGAH